MNYITLIQEVKGKKMNRDPLLLIVLVIVLAAVFLVFINPAIINLKVKKHHSDVINIQTFQGIVISKSIFHGNRSMKIIIQGKKNKTEYNFVSQCFEKIYNGIEVGDSLFKEKHSEYYTMKTKNSGYTDTYIYHYKCE